MTEKELQIPEYLKCTCKKCGSIFEWNEIGCLNCYTKLTNEEPPLISTNKLWAFINEHKETMSMADEDFKKVDYITINKLEEFFK